MIDKQGGSGPSDGNRQLESESSPAVEVDKKEEGGPSKKKIKIFFLAILRLEYIIYYV
jgi:hypothetical protein